MYIGTLDYEKEITFTHVDTKIPFPPSQTENGVYSFKGDTLFDLGVDAAILLDRECYVGAVNFIVPKASLASAEILIDGKTAGRYTPPQSELFGGRISIPVGRWAKALTLRFFADFQDVVLEELVILGAYEDGVPLVWPTPKSIGAHKGYAHIADVVAATDDADECFAAQFLRERLSEKLGEWKQENGITVIIKKAPSDERERYTLTHAEAAVTVSASTRIALLYGCDTILSLTDQKGLYLADVDDRPSKPLRGFHFGLPHRDRIEFAKLLMRYVLIPMRYNVVFLEFAGGMRFDRHPEISEGWLDAAQKAKEGKQPFMPHSDKVSWYSLLEKDEVRELVGYIKELGLALIPEIQSLSHVQYITYAHPEIAERDANEEPITLASSEIPPSAFYAHSYCPSHPKSYEIIYDIIDEIVEVTEPSEYVHMGHDEVYQLGICPRCLGKDRSKLFADHIIAMHDYLAKKGLKMMMWCDMLHPHRNADGEAQRIPKDIVMLDFIWYFRPNSDIEDNILKHGFKVMVGNLYSSHYTRFQSRITKEGMLGGEVSTWIIADEEIYGKNGKFWDIMYLSEMLWNTEGYEETNRKTYTHILSKNIQPSTRDKMRHKYRPNGYEETRLPLSGDGEGLPRDLCALCPDVKRGESVSISVNAAYDRLIFEHATLRAAQRIIWKPHITIGEYRIEYEDGTRETAEIRYAENVMCYRSGYGTPKHEQYYSHLGYVGTWFSDPIYEGKTEAGDDITVSGYLWENPYPKKKIARITYTPSKNDFCTLVLASVRGLKEK